MNTDFIKLLAAVAVSIAPACTSEIDNPSLSPGTDKLHFEVSGQVPQTKTSIDASEIPGEPGKYVYVVTALDRMQNESKAKKIKVKY